MHDDTKERDQCLTLPDRGSFVGVIVSAGARNRFTRLLGAGKAEKARKVFSLACVVSVRIALLGYQEDRLPCNSKFVVRMQSYLSVAIY